MSPKALVGIFVGGRASRMGGVPKGLLPSPDGGDPIVVRLARITREALPDAEIVLVGDAPAYGSLGLPVLRDEPPGQGPLGGLSALLQAGRERGRECIAMAGDLPFVTRDLVMHLATHAPDAPAVAPRVEGIWQPLFARYSPPACEPLVKTMLSQRRLAPWRLLEALGERAEALPLDGATIGRLADWDTPEDAKRGAPPGLGGSSGPLRP
jgi:molybdopterin-guanine dinucleotide biosynthesis protein A